MSGNGHIISCQNRSRPGPVMYVQSGQGHIKVRSSSGHFQVKVRGRSSQGQIVKVRSKLGQDQDKARSRTRSGQDQGQGNVRPRSGRQVKVRSG